jgi:hypothetical protein
MRAKHVVPSIYVTALGVNQMMNHSMKTPGLSLGDLVQALVLHWVCFDIGLEPINLDCYHMAITLLVICISASIDRTIAY